MKSMGLEGSSQFADLRARAESRLAGPHRPYLTPVPAEPARLVRELQLHRAELEMQNDELRETELQLLDANERYRDLYDAAPVAYVSLDQRGRITETNHGACELLASSRRQLLGAAFSRFLAPADADRFHVHRWEVLSGGDRRTTQLDLHRPDGVRMSVRIDSSAVTTSTGTECRSALIDVTERQRVERSLVARERELSALLEAVADGVLSFDAEGAIVWASAGAATLLGRLRSELLGSPIDDVLCELARGVDAIDVSIRRLDEQSFVAVLTRAR